MKCPACRVNLDDNAKFCGKCGQRIPRCPTCGEPVTSRSKFCGKDGTLLPQEVLDLLPADHQKGEGNDRVKQNPAPKQETAEKAKQAPKPEVIIEDPDRTVYTGSAGRYEAKTETKTKVRQTPAEQTEKTRAASTCARCGGPCPEGRKLCPSCIAQLRQQGAAPQPPKKKFCAHCGAVVTDGQPLCTACRGQRKGSGGGQKKKSEGSKTGMIVLIALLAVVIVLLAALTIYVAVTGEIPFSASRNDTQWENPLLSQEPTTSSWFAVEPKDNVSVETVAPPAQTAAPATIPATESPTEPPTEPPTEAPTEPPIDEDERVLYWLEYCDSMYLSSSDLEGFDEEMCRIARNGIYAKSGRMFNDSELQEYYEQYDWYEPTVSPSSFTAGMLNEYQNANLNLIMNYERSHGYR